MLLGLRGDWLEPGMRLFDPAREGVAGNGIMAGNISILSRSGVRREGRRDIWGRVVESNVDDDTDDDIWLTDREELELNPCNRACGLIRERNGVAVLQSPIIILSHDCSPPLSLSSKFSRSLILFAADSS